MSLILFQSIQHTHTTKNCKLQQIDIGHRISQLNKLSSILINDNGSRWRWGDKICRKWPFFRRDIIFLEETAICIRTFMYVHVSIIIAQFWLHFVWFTVCLGHFYILAKTWEKETKGARERERERMWNTKSQ